MDIVERARRKADLVRRIKDLGFPEKEVVLTLDEFFEGNDDRGSIGVNIPVDQPLPQDFYSTLRALIDRGDAERILVRITDIEDPKTWFYTDTVHVIGRIAREQLADDVAVLKPDEVYPGWMYGLPVNAEPVPDGMQVYSLWWD